MQNFKEIVSGEPLYRGIKWKTGSKLEQFYVRVSHLLMSFLLNKLISTVSSSKASQQTVSDAFRAENHVRRGITIAEVFL